MRPFAAGCRMSGGNQSGKFADEWNHENQKGGERYEALLEEDLNHPIEEVGARLRSRMAWLKQEEAA